MTIETEPGPAPTAPPKTGPKRSYKRMSEEVKAEAVVLWKAGNMELKELSARFHVPVATLRQHFKLVGAKKGDASASIAAKRAAAIEEAMVLDPLVHARRVFDTKNETYRITEMLRKLVAGEIVKCRQENRKLGTIYNEIKTIREAASTIKICREEAFAVLGVRPDDQGDENLPDLVITDLTADDIQDLQQMPSEDDMGDAASKMEADEEADEEGGGE